MRVVVAVPGPFIDAWEFAAITALRRLANVEVSVALVRGSAHPARWPVISRIAGPALERVAVIPDVSGLDGFDVTLDLTAASVTSDSPHGVWSFVLGDSNDRRLPFAREVVSHADVVDVRLVRRLAGRTEALRSGRFPLPMWLPTVLRLTLDEAAHWPATFVAAIRDGIELPALPVADAMTRRPLRVRESGRFVSALARRFAASMNNAFLTVDQWNVGFADCDPRDLLAGRPLDVRWLPDPPARTFVADPFVVERDGRRVLFVEDFSYERNRGVIDALVLDADDRVVSRRRAIDLDTHLSYPFPLEIDGELYLVPENCDANEVALYRCVEFPHRWQRESAVFPAFDGVDTTLFVHDGRWWAFCTRYGRGSSVALHVYHGPSPRGPWTSHPLNPVVVDCSCARPAGPTFVVDGALYRPGQDCSRTYGGAVAILRVDELTPDRYVETLVRRIEPVPGRFPDGLHTVSFAGGRLILDGKRSYRDFRNLRRAVRMLRARVARSLDRARRHGSDAALKLRPESAE